MADKPFIAARLRNPADAQPAAKAKPAGAKKADWIGGVAALISIVLAAVTTYWLWDEMELVKTYFTSIGLPF